LWHSFVLYCTERLGKGCVRVMSEQQPHTSSSRERPLPWWLLLCRRLWKILAFFGGSSVALALLINILATWLTTSKGALPAASPLGVLLTHWPLSLLVGICFSLLAALVWAISRWDAQVGGRHLPTEQDRERMIRRIRFLYEQLLAQSLEGVVQVDLGLTFRPAAVRNAVALSLHLPDRSEQALAPGTSILEAYELAQQDLLILG